MRTLIIGTIFALHVAGQSPGLVNLSKLPITFEPNYGQSDPRVRFLARAGNLTVFLTDREVVLTPRQGPPVRMRLAGSQMPRTIEGLEPTGGRSNYLIGNDPAQYRTNIPNFGSVRYKDVYPGIDIVYHGSPRLLEFDLVIAPGAGRRDLEIEYEGVESLRTDGGALILTTSAGEFRLERPLARQGDSEVEVTYRVSGPRRVRLEIAPHDPARLLVVDPVLRYSTYLGGQSDDSGGVVAVDAGGTTYVAGAVYSPDFPTADPLQASIKGAPDAFVVKLNPAGDALVYSTYLGGHAYDIAEGLSIDANGSVYLTGLTDAIDFPTVNPMQAASGGGTDAFVAKLNASGSALVYSTYLGGILTDASLGIAIDSDGNAYVTGHTASPNFPTTNPIQASRASEVNAFVTKLDASGSARVYSTYLGGIEESIGYGIAVDQQGNAYVTGQASAGFPTTVNAFQPNLAGSTDLFISKLNPSGSALVYSTYLGGSSTEIAGTRITLDSDGNAYITGASYSSDFPVVNSIAGSHQPGISDSDAVIAKLNAAGSALVYATCLGGSFNDYGEAIAVDGGGNVYLTGYTTSTDFPTANPVQAAYGGGIPRTHDAFVAKVSASGSALLFSTYLGGSENDEGYGIAVDASGNQLVTGASFFAGFPTVNPIQSNNAGYFDAFVLSLSGNSPTGVFRDASGGMWFSSPLSSQLTSLGGVFASDPASAQNARGDTYVVARDNFGAIWLNVYDTYTHQWDGWQFAGGIFQGVPSIAVIADTAYVVARDQYDSYWTTTFMRGAGFDAWTNRGGVFAVDPVSAAAAGSNTVYIVGKDDSNAIWTAVWNGGFSGWQFQGAVVAGNPAVSAGSDDAAYIAVRDTFHGVWMGRQDGTVFNGWQPGGGVIATGPKIAAAGGNVYAAALTASGAVWYNVFLQGTGNNWQGWQSPGGILQDLAVAASTGPQLFLTGSDLSNQLWWYETPGAGWRYIGYPGLLAGPPAAAPR